MTAQNRSPFPLHLQPKAAATSKSSQLSATGTASNTPAASRSSSRARPAKARNDGSSSDFTSRKTTLALIRRVLAPDAGHGSDPRASPKPVEDLLPPLTSSNEVDVQLYAIIAIVVKDFVNSWYSKITPDHVFVEEVIQIIAHCSRALEQRLRQIDIEEMILDEIPALIEQHVHAYRMAQANSITSKYSLNPLQIYHSLNPHPALSPIPGQSISEDASDQQLRNESTYRQLLVQGALAVLLPTEDLENTCLRILVGDIIADLILGQAVSGKVCEGWFLHEAIAKIVGIVKDRVEPKATGEQLHADTRSRLENFGLLPSKADDEKYHSPSNYQSAFSALFWRIMQYGYLAVIFLRFVVVGMSQTRYRPARSRHARLSPTSPTVSKTPQTLSPHSDLEQHFDLSIRPVLTYRIAAAVSTLLELSTRMPWLASTLSFCQHWLTAGPGRFGSTNSLFDKFLYNTIRTFILPPSLLPPLLLNLRASLFPNNTIGPHAPPPPSPIERLAIRRRAAESILTLIPPIVGRVFFATTDEASMVSQIEEIIDIFGDARFNRYLVYGIVELVLIRLVPELAEKGWSELCLERGVSIGGETNSTGSTAAGEEARHLPVPAEAEVSIAVEGDL